MWRVANGLDRVLLRRFIDFKNVTDFAELTLQFDLYGYVEGMLSNTFAIDGKACVQRLICELSEVPIRDTNMLGEALHFLIE